MGYKWFDLDQRANEYVEGKLRAGRTLSKLCLETLALKSGRVLTYLPANSPEASIYDFQNSVVVTEDDTTEELIHYISTYLTQNPDNIAVFEDSAALKSDPGLNEATTHMFYYGQEVYHTLNSSDSGDDFIRKTVLEASNAWQNLLFLTTCPASYDLHGRSIDEGTMVTLAKGVGCIFVDSYDLDGYLLWKRD